MNNINIDISDKMTEYYKKRNIKNGLDINQKIYKIISLKWLIPMIENKRLTLLPVKNWDDPWENLFCKLKLELSTGEQGNAENQMQGIFGQSWSWLEESDAMWRIYSKIDTDINTLDDVGVKIVTTAEKLYNAVYTGDKDMANVYIGKVDYRDEQNIVEFMKQDEPWDFNDIMTYAIKSLFMKRDTFSHEQEVRIVGYYANNQEQFGRDNIQFEIDPDDFIEQLIIDPRVNDCNAQRIKGQLMKLGIRCDKITKSRLYALPDITVKLQ